MSKELSLFENMPDEFKRMLAQLQPDKNALGGSTSSVKRLSIRGGVFRQIINGKEVAELESRTLKVVIVRAAPVTRMFFAGKYVPGQTTAPTCWSEDTSTGVPSANVDAGNKQSEACFDCKQNIKGSGAGEGRACRYQQRIAVLLVNADNTLVSGDVYQLSLPATSVFGDDKKKMGLQAYARFIDAQGAPLASLITELRFDTDSSTPKLIFKPVRILEKSEIAVVIEAQQNPETQKLLDITVKKKDTAQGDIIASSSSDDAVDEVIDEPKVKPSKKNDRIEPQKDLASLLDQFDDS